MNEAGKTGAPLQQDAWRYVRYLFLAFLGLWILFTLFPLYFMTITAFKTAAETNLTQPTFWPRDWKPGNFAGVFAERTNFHALVDSFIIATANTGLALFLGSLAGYAFARFPRQAGGENLAFWILSNGCFRRLPSSSPCSSCSTTRLGARTAIFR